jgi:hypothetical protein
MWTIGQAIYDPDWLDRTCILRYNQGRAWRIGRCRRITDRVAPPRWRSSMAVAAARQTWVLHALWCKDLRDLYTKMTSRRATFLPKDLLRSRMIPRCCVMVAPFLQAWSSMAASSCARLAPTISWEASPWPPPDLLLGLNCGERQRINMHEKELLVARVWFLWTKFELIRLAFIGHLVQSCSLCGL